MGSARREYCKQQASVIRSGLTERVNREIDELLAEKEYLMAVSLRRCESPIEQLLLLRILKWRELYESHYKGFDNELVIDIFTQYEVEANNRKYRLDILIELVFQRASFKFAIECDGHEFHEKTKEQAARDKQRERDLQSIGYQVVRFTGSEIWEDPGSCAKEIKRIIERVTGIHEKEEEAFQAFSKQMEIED